MSIKLVLEFAVLIGALLMGARAGGVGLGLWGAVGLLVLVVGFGVPPGAIPGEVLIIVLTVIMAASAMEVAGGVDFLVRLAERIIRKNPKRVTIVAPLVTYGWGVIPAAVRLGGTEWTTSLWPKDGRYVLPLKDVVRNAEGLEEGDTVTVRLTPGGPRRRA